MYTDGQSFPHGEAEPIGHDVTVALTTRYSLTAAPRSAVVHVINAGSPSAYWRTICGRRIGDEWAGEYTEAPTGPVTCKRCKTVADEVDAENAAILAGVAVHPVGSTVGILVGQLSVNGPHVDRYGTVVRHVETWNGECEYVVADAYGEAVYRRWVLVADETPDNDADTDDRQAREEAANADADSLMGEILSLLSPTWEDRADSEARARSMAAHPAGKRGTVQIIGAHVIDGATVIRPAHRDPITGAMIFPCDTPELSR